MRRQDATLPATLGSTKEARYSHLRAICDGCLHTTELEVEILIIRFGETYEIPSLAHHFSCASCDSKGVTIHVIASS